MCWKQEAVEDNVLPPFRVFDKIGVVYFIEANDSLPSVNELKISHKFGDQYSF